MGAEPAPPPTRIEPEATDAGGRHGRGTGEIGNAPEVPPVTDCGKEMEQTKQSSQLRRLLYMNWPEVQVPVMGGGAGDNVGGGGSSNGLLGHVPVMVMLVPAVGDGEDEPVPPLAIGRCRLRRW